MIATSQTLRIKANPKGQQADETISVLCNKTGTLKSFVAVKNPLLEIHKRIMQLATPAWHMSDDRGAICNSRYGKVW